MAISNEIKHVGLGRRNGKKPIPSPQKPVFTSSKVSMSGFTVRGIENEISYTQRGWPTFILKELGDNAYDFFNESYPNSPKEHRKIAYRIWRPYSAHGTPEWNRDEWYDPRFFIVRIAVTSSNVDNLPVFEDLPSIFDLDRYTSSKRMQYKGGTGELGDGLKRALKIGYASWIEHPLNGGNYSQWEEPIILTFNRQRYTVTPYVDTEIDEAKVIINRDHNAVINSTDTEVSVPIPIRSDYESVAERLGQYYRIYKIPKRKTRFSFFMEAN